MTHRRLRVEISLSRRYRRWARALCVATLCAPKLNAENVTLTTYYPAPSGVYTKMITTGETFLARDPGGKLIIGGSVVPGFLGTSDVLATQNVFFGTGGSYKVSNAGLATLGASSVGNLTKNSSAMHMGNTGGSGDAFVFYSGAPGGTRLAAISHAGEFTTSAAGGFGSIKPMGDNVGNIGTTARRWNNVHAVQFYGNMNPGPDLAERYPSSEALEPGDVVVFDRTPSSETTLFDQSQTDTLGATVAGKRIPVAVRKSASAYEPGVLGVVSTAPGVRMRDPDDDHNPPIALVGRVPVKVSAENGPIRIGDFLTASSRPGYAMKATAPGTAVGIALEAFDGKSLPEGRILCSVRAGEQGGGEALRRLQDDNLRLTERIEALEKRLTPR